MKRQPNSCFLYFSFHFLPLLGVHTHTSIAEPLFKLLHSSIISLSKSNLIEMYAETGLMFPYFQNFSLQAQNLDDFCRSNSPNSSMGSLAQTSTILEYDLGGEGDLFKAPEPIIEQPLVDINLMTASISMISCGQDAISSQPLKAVDIELIENEQFLSEVFYYDCKKDMLVKNGTETPFSEIMDIKIPVVATDQNLLKEEKMLSQGSFPKSVSYECLCSMDWVNGPQVGPDFLNLPGIDFSADYGMRRAFSEGDIKTLANGNVSLVQSPLGQQQPIFSNCTSEERMEKLSRYRNKKAKRNFGRKIKYACRKALADSQPRIRGRFAKTEETDVQHVQT